MIDITLIVFSNALIHSKRLFTDESITCLGKNKETDWHYLSNTLIAFFNGEKVITLAR